MKNHSLVWAALLCAGLVPTLAPRPVEAQSAQAEAAQAEAAHVEAAHVEAAPSPL